jgi:hypothetical protein
MTDYNWVDNPTEAGIANCDPDILNEALMHLKYNNDSAKVGDIKFTTKNTVDAGWFRPVGAEMSRTVYADLFDAYVTNAGFTSQEFTVSIASPAVFTKTAHGFTGGERLRLSTTGSLPTGLNSTADYFVKKLTADTFNLYSDKELATIINTSGTQSGTHTYMQSLYGLGDGTTTFRQPDLRDVFPVMSDSKAFGSWQADSFKAHTHNAYHTYVSNRPEGSGTMMPINNSVSLEATSSTGGAETIPKHIPLNILIKY